MDVYAKNKCMYIDLEKISASTDHTNQLGGYKKTYSLFTDKERQLITETFDKVETGGDKCEKNSLKTLSIATSGMMINSEERREQTKSDLCNLIRDARRKRRSPIVHDDSMTAWGNHGAAMYGLTIGDIMNMKFGEKLELIIFDRNVGDYVHKKKKGDRYDPKKEGCTYATYIHGEGLTGILNMFDIGVVHAPFVWELNLKAIDKKYPFWGPIDLCTSGKKQINVYDLDKSIKVGWRGPAISLSDAKKYLPDKVVHYNTWWDDYLPFKNSNLTDDAGHDS